MTVERDMRLLSVKSAKSIWLFPVSDLNPRGKYEVAFVEAIGVRYRFVQMPNLAEAIKRQEGLKFDTGFFRHETLGDLHVTFTIHNDGVVADTNASTEASDAFLTDLTNWVVETFGLTRPQRIGKVYASELYVSTETNLSQVSDKVASLTTKVGEALGTGSKKLECAGLWFARDFEDGRRSPSFRFERAEGSPFKENRYYSSATTQTSKHLALLDSMEKIMAS
jgi:hypothetical protein